MTVSISISDAFDGGNIKFIRQNPDENDPNTIDIVLHIKPDVYTVLEKIGHMQYFSFRSTVSGLEGASKKVKYIIENAGASTNLHVGPKAIHSSVLSHYFFSRYTTEAVSYPEAWPGTTICYSNNVEDPDSWKRNLDTFYMDGKLSWEHDHTKNGSVFFSYFPPFSYARHLNLVSKCAEFANVESLGQTLDGREIECVIVGEGNLTCWIIHRQHPGENMAEHYAEGLLCRLLGLETKGEVDDQVKKILSLYKFYIVPCMCLDGVVRGHLRTNGCGANLNREWATKRFYEAPTLERSPEVYYVLNKMDQTVSRFQILSMSQSRRPSNLITFTAAGC